MNNSKRLFLKKIQWRCLQNPVTFSVGHMVWIDPSFVVHYFWINVCTLLDQSAPNEDF